MLHVGSAPNKHIKYGVNCFLNVMDMRQVVPAPPDLSLEQGAVVQVSDLGKDQARSSGSGNANANDAAASCDRPRLVACRLSTTPKVMAMPAFLSESEAEHFLRFLSSGAGACETLGIGAGADSDLFCEGTQTLRTVEFEETELVKSVEQRLATAG